MTQTMTTTRVSLIGRLRVVLLHPLVLTTTLAAIVPMTVVALALAMTTSITPLVFVAMLLGTLVFGLLLGYVNYRGGYQQTQDTLQKYINVLEQVANGDLRVRVSLPQGGQFTREAQTLRHMAGVINRVLDTVQAVILDFNAALKQLETDTEAILDATKRQITMGNEQDAVVTETTATVNEVRATVTETAERAQSVAETAQFSVDVSRTGTDAVDETVTAMELIRRRVEDIADNILVLSEHTQQIGEIIATVNNLADQSRMLALNASVEAARAGEEGKGFAVVAMEVRNLADQNRNATVQVREILGEIQRATNIAVMVTEEGSKGVDSGQQRVNKAGESIRDLSKAIEEAALAAMQIAASTRQQTIGMDQLTDAMRTIKHATSETVSSTMQVEASVNRLRDAANRVSTVLDGLEYE